MLNAEPTHDVISLIVSTYLCAANISRFICIFVEFRISVWVSRICKWFLWGELSAHCIESIGMCAGMLGAHRAKILAHKTHTQWRSWWQKRAPKLLQKRQQRQFVIIGAAIVVVIAQLKWKCVENWSAYAQQLPEQMSNEMNKWQIKNIMVSHHLHAYGPKRKWNVAIYSTYFVLVCVCVRGAPFHSFQEQQKNVIIITCLNVSVCVLLGLTGVRNEP